MHTHSFVEIAVIIGGANRMELAAGPGQMLMIWTAEPGSNSAEALSLLGSWAAAPGQPGLQDVPDHP